MHFYLSKISLASIKRNHRGVMGGQHLPEEGECLIEGCCWSKVWGRQLHLLRHRTSSWSRKEKSLHGQLNAGSRVTIELTPYYIIKARNKLNEQHFTQVYIWASGRRAFVMKKVVISSNSAHNAELSKATFVHLIERIMKRLCSWH